MPPVKGKRKGKTKGRIRWKIVSPEKALARLVCSPQEKLLVRTESHIVQEGSIVVHPACSETRISAAWRKSGAGECAMKDTK